MFVVFLYGKPACGKKTIALELEKLLTDVPVFHNHLTVDLTLKLFQFGTEPFKALRANIWIDAFKLAAEHNRSFIFTFCPEDTISPETVKKIVQPVLDAKDSKVYFVELFCSEEQILERLNQTSRQGTGKLTDVEFYKKLNGEGVFTWDPDKVVVDAPFLTLDTGKHSAAEAAQIISAKIAEDSAK
eukprot:TRINITY_DN2834_c0_g1_i1.p1 TRINITY_DN2834_c0_g1~~TRINITY_DN2834_c0_g1_i1.p1  ORF type:complete len:186 (+),score=33.67 TRINITY_DN2834_c0_g1_i1:76-633(+)